MKAFPVWTDEAIFNQGMDLRDYFAAKAMQGLLAANPDVDAEDVIEALAIAAYQTADAMMKERK